MNKNVVFFLIHFSAWIIAGFIGAAIAHFAFPPVDYPFFLLISLAYAYYMLVSFYTFYLFLVPKYLGKKKYKTFALNAICIVLILFSLDQLFWIGLDNPSIKIKYSYIGVVIGALFCGVLGIFYRFGIDWFKIINLKRDLENKNLMSELRTIKSRLNPHFLFNTLNNIDTLIQTNPSDASYALSQLSEILRYAVYDSEKEKVAFKKEINNLEKYIELEKLRLVNPSAVTFKSDVSNEVTIPPMLFFPFVENGFKHSDLNQPNHKLAISIREEHGNVVFNCINTINSNEHYASSSGVGLELAKKRLNLLFPNTHKLTIEEVDNEFCVRLEIEIA